jgi:hypothetical protein
VSEQGEVAQDVMSLIAFHKTRWSRLPRVCFDRTSWLGRQLAPLLHLIHLPKATDQIAALVSPTCRYPTFQDHINTTLLHGLDMARRGRFHVLPADNTYPIKDFDMFKTVAKAPEPRHASRSVS